MGSTSVEGVNDNACRKRKEKPVRVYIVGERGTKEKPGKGIDG